MHKTTIPWDSLPILSIKDWLVIERKKRVNRANRLSRKRRKAKLKKAQDKTHPWIRPGLIESEES